jgi:hypothetical protein
MVVHKLNRNCPQGIVCCMSSHLFTNWYKPINLVYGTFLWNVKYSCSCCSAAKDPHPSCLTILHRTDCIRPHPSCLTILHRTDCIRPHPSCLTILHRTDCISPHPSCLTILHRTDCISAWSRMKRCRSALISQCRYSCFTATNLEVSILRQFNSGKVLVSLMNTVPIQAPVCVSYPLKTSKAMEISSHLVEWTTVSQPIHVINKQPSQTLST